MATSILTLRGATLVSGLESVLIFKSFPDFAETYFQSLSKLVLSVFAFNYALLFLYSAVIYPDFVSPLRHFPRPKRWLSRMIYTRLFTKRTQGQLLQELIQQVPNDGILALRELTDIRLLVTKPSVLAELFVHQSYDFEKPPNMRKFLGKLIGNGLITAEGDSHKFMKKNSQNAFSFRRVRELYPMMWDHSLDFTEALRSTIKQQSDENNVDEKHLTGKVEILGWASRITLDIIGVAGFGLKLNALEGADNAFVRSYKTLFSPSKEMLLFFALSAWFSAGLVRMIPWRMNKVFEDTENTLSEACLRLVRSKRQAIQNKEDGHIDIVSLLIKSGHFTDESLCDQLLTLLAAGQDTTALSLTWATYLLAIDPARQTRLRREVQEALASVSDLEKDEQHISNTLERLPYLGGVISETLRLYPAVPVTIRVACRDTSLDGKPIPKGTEMLISPYLVNRSPDLWGADAEEFRPERWIEKDGRPNNTGGAGSNYEFITFLHGPRVCIGQGFARAELRCLLAAFVTRFEWSLAMDERDVIPGGTITLSPMRGIHVQLKAIDE